MRADLFESQEERLRSRENGLWYSPSDLLTFDIFKSDYWPHLPRNLTKGICVSSLHHRCFPDLTAISSPNPSIQ